MTQAERHLLVRDAQALIARYEEELVDTWLDGMLSMLRRLAEVVEEDGYQRLEIHERCLRDTKGDQLWEAHAEYLGRVGPTVQSYSRKNVRTKARTAFGAQRV